MRHLFSTKRIEDFEKDRIEFEKIQQCRHPEHNPPSHMVYKHFSGTYVHICPGCGRACSFVVGQNDQATL